MFSSSWPYLPPPPPPQHARNGNGHMTPPPSKGYKLKTLCHEIKLSHTWLECVQIRWPRSMIFELRSLSHFGTFALKTLLIIDNYLCFMNVQGSKCASRSHFYFKYMCKICTNAQRCEDVHYWVPWTDIVPLKMSWTENIVHE